MSSIHCSKQLNPRHRRKLRQFPRPEPRQDRAGQGAFGGPQLDLHKVPHETGSDRSEVPASTLWLDGAPKANPLRTIESLQGSRLEVTWQLLIRIKTANTFVKNTTNESEPIQSLAGSSRRAAFTNKTRPPKGNRVSIQAFVLLSWYGDCLPVPHRNNYQCRNHQSGDADHRVGRAKRWKAGGVDHPSTDERT